LGIEYYYKIPKLKLLWHIGRNIKIREEDLERFEENLRQLRVAIEELFIGESEYLLEKKFKDLTLKDLAVLTTIADKSWILNEFSFDAEIFGYLLKKKGLDFSVVSDLDEEYKKAKKQGYKEIAWWID